MKTFFSAFWNLQFEPGCCKYDNVAVLHLFVDIKGGVVRLWIALKGFFLSDLQFHPGFNSVVAGGVM